jgi:hypothetical protein
MKPLKVLENREKSLAWKKGLFLTTVVLGLLFLGSCAAGPNSMLGSTAEGAEDPCGLFLRPLAWDDFLHHPYRFLFQQ